jgi:hypothetical protein
MNLKSSDVSDAVVLYLGHGTASHPQLDSRALMERFGDRRAVELEAAIGSLLNEAGRINVDWSSHTLESAGDLVVAEMRRRHPALTARALAAIAWKFTFDWR